MTQLPAKVCRIFTLALLALAMGYIPFARAQESLNPSFDVAVIRPVNPDGQHGFGWKVTPSGRFTAVESLRNLMVIAYGGDGQILGGPSWTDTDWFDINAKLDAPTLAGWDKLTNTEQYERMKPMIRALLAERFKLKLHTEIQMTPVFALVQVKSGAKLTAVPPPPPEDAETQQARASGQPMEKAPPGGFKRIGNTIVANAMPMANLKGMIGAWSGADRIVIDETGLTGTYDFTLKISLDKDGLTIAEQIEQQLGLKLEPRKVPMTTYIIDSAEKPSVDGA